MLKKSALAAIGLFATAATVPAHASQLFDFSFTAPLTNGDTASGSGQLLTADADADGQYHLLSVSGSFFAYAGEVDPRPITSAFAVDDSFNFSDGYLYQDAMGSFVTDSVVFQDIGTFNLIAFTARVGGLYNGFFSEVGVHDATLTFSPISGAVPEPETWGMMVLGLGAIGAAMRSRRTAKVTFA